MSRAEAISQYESALSQGKRYYRTAMAKGLYPYPQVLDKLLESQNTAGMVNLGLVDIPIDRIVGTWVEGRKSAFAGNMMPLLPPESEFGEKWIALCESHLDYGGIRDAISCYEYLGYFYVQEGHKRVSVLKSFGALTIPGTVMRVVPALTDDPDIRLYYEFMDFYKATRLYQVSFTRPGGYARLQAALGYAPDQVWPEDDRRDFASDYRRFSTVFDQLNTEKLPLAAGDALLSFLQIHSYAELKAMTSDQIRAALSGLWPDIRLLAQGEPISVSAAPEEKEKGLLGRILGTPRLHAAFIYQHDPEKSAWASAHHQGQKQLEEALGDEVTVTSHLCGADPDATMEQAIAEGANVLFATSPTLIDACRRVAAAHKSVAVFNCSLSMPYAGVRSYYCRIYEGKFITGAIAGAMAHDDRIGYVANYPIMGVTASINAFALGVRMTNPRAKIILKWSCLPGNPILELKEAGVSVISNRDEDSGNHSSWDLGTYMVTPEHALQPLASPRWNWGSYYEKTVRSLMSGGVEALRDSKHAINDWWGIDSGVVNIDIDENLPEGVKQLGRILKKDILEESLDPFLCPILDQNSQLISDGTRAFTPEELMKIDWLNENIEGKIPTFDELLPRSQNLVRLLGIYRDTIPPKTEEETAL